MIDLILVQDTLLIGTRVNCVLRLFWSELYRNYSFACNILVNRFLRLIGSNYPGTKVTLFVPTVFR